MNRLRSGRVRWRDDGSVPDWVLLSIMKETMWCCVSWRLNSITWTIVYKTHHTIRNLMRRHIGHDRRSIHWWLLLIWCIITAALQCQWIEWSARWERTTWRNVIFTIAIIRCIINFCYVRWVPVLDPMKRYNAAIVSAQGGIAECHMPSTMAMIRFRSAVVVVYYYLLWLRRVCGCGRIARISIMMFLFLDDDAQNSLK